MILMHDLCMTYACRLLLMLAATQLQLVDLVSAPTRVTMTSSTQIDVLMSTLVL